MKKKESKTGWERECDDNGVKYLTKLLETEKKEKLVIIFTLRRT